MNNKIPSLLIFAPAVFLGAFLLFQVQPLIGKYILPWFGGSPEVWTTCMLFFQVFLLIGYAYAHLVVRYLRPRIQSVVHVVVIIAALAVLPITPAAAWKPQGPEYPTLRILLLLSACIGLPYFVLSATGPLMQGWFNRTNPSDSPYRLYSLSNAGSLLALLSYPFIVEPALSRQSQANLWSWSLGAFAVFAGICALWLWKHHQPKKPPPDKKTAHQDADDKKNWGLRLLWLALPAGASVELLAVTNKICQDVAAIPFLWILPLCLYLLSFIICFHHEKWYVRPVFLGVFILSIVVVALVQAWGWSEDLSVIQQIAMYSAVLFACCMVCHGELYRLRPDPRHLTGYYLMIATGGAIGGILVAVVAPLVFNTYLELHLGLLACCLFVLLADKESVLRRSPRRWVWIGLIIVVGVAAVSSEGHRGDANKIAILNSRNFFGVLTVWENDRSDPAMHRYILQHGSTFHGLQFVDPKKHRRPLAYFGPNSGAGVAIRFFRRQENRHIGVVGLGVGTISAYGKKGDRIRFYEINPAVEQIARTRFSYLSDCRGEVDVIMGDARLSMEAETPQEFDLLVLDAFSGGAVPVHLLTVEAFEIFLEHLKSDGVIAMHVSSVHLDLQSVIWKIARRLGLKTAWIQNDENDTEGIFASDWILLTRDESFINQKVIQIAATPPKSDLARIDLWTDDHINLFQILKR
ncbi:MAG: fused MFS/spermidine synthase [Planctomycetota bacterium]|nr:fused MFS/spermidine synthase [Planctomycetota bacterium]